MAEGSNELRRELNKAEKDYILKKSYHSNEGEYKAVLVLHETPGKWREQSCRSAGKHHNHVMIKGRLKHSCSHLFASVFTTESEANVPSMGTSNIGDITKLINL